MTTVNIVAGIALVAMVGMAYFINELLAEIAALKNILNDRADRLTNAALEIESLKRKMEKISEITK